MPKDQDKLDKFVEDVKNEFNNSQNNEEEKWVL